MNANKRLGMTIFGIVLIVGVGEFMVGYYFGKMVGDRWYAEHWQSKLPMPQLISEHSIKGMAFEGDCRIVPPTGPPVTQDFQDNTFTYEEGPCFIGARGMKITRHSKAPERITSESGISCTVPAMSREDAIKYFNTHYCDNGVARPLKELLGHQMP